MEPASLPPADTGRSPRTGWTRAHWVAVADQLLHGAQRHATPGRARIAPPGRPSWSGPDSDGREGFARTFLLLALRLAGEGGADPAGLLERYADGLAHGTDPAHPEAWPAMGRRAGRRCPRRPRSRSACT